jgi:hypothetical protein
MSTSAPIRHLQHLLSTSAPTAPVQHLQHLFSTYSTYSTCSAPTAPTAPIQHLAVELGAGSLHLPPCKKATQTVKNQFWTFKMVGNRKFGIAERYKLCFHWINFFTWPWGGPTLQFCPKIKNCFKTLKNTWVKQFLRVIPNMSFVFIKNVYFDSL